MIRGEGCTLQSDLWALGIFLYELIGGFTPFEHIQDPMEMCSMTLESGYEFPKNINFLQKDLVSKLLVLDPMQRLSLGQIKTHLMFLKLNFEDLKEKRITPPFMPAEEYL